MGLNYWVGHGVFPNLFFHPNGAVTSVDSLFVNLAYTCLCPSAVSRCVSKFRPLFGDLYWSTTWSHSMHGMPFDRHVPDFSWLLAHGVVLTADRLGSSFGMSSVSPDCGAPDCGAPLEIVDHLFFECPFSSGCFGLGSVSAPSLCLRHVLFGFEFVEFTVIPWLFAYLVNRLLTSSTPYLVGSERLPFQEPFALCG